MDERFQPEPWARNPHLQTIFGSLGLRLRGANEMAAAAETRIVDAGDGTRLLGSLSRQSARVPKGLIVLLHGWEGSADSTYILSTGRTFYRLGYDIFRLNLRDHGPSHHLNRGLFHGALTEETAQAVASACRLLPEGPCYLIGFSLGGNFALRVALRQTERPIANLRAVFCISPALDPHKATLAIDTGFPVYRRYFLAKWKRSLRQKQRCFPDLYDFGDVLHHRTCMDLTRAIMRYYPEFPSHLEYFRHYTLTGHALAGLSMPVTIFAAQDDPLIAVEDFHGLPLNAQLRLSIQERGGHCGFLAPFPWGCWYERRIAEQIDRERRA